MCVQNLRVISAFPSYIVKTINIAANPYKYQLHLLTFSEKMFCKQSQNLRRLEAEATVTYMASFSETPQCHENEQMFFFVYIYIYIYIYIYHRYNNKTVIALYLDFIHSYLF